MDPNGVIGAPREYDVWLSPDWSDFDEKTKKKSDWSRVRVRETKYNDGRIVTSVLTDGAPVSQIGDTQIDKDQERRFKEAQTAASRPPEERNNNGRRERWNPSTSSWDDIGVAVNTTAAPAAPTAGQKPQGSTTQIEGTPLPGGGFDNERPVMVTRGPNGQLILSEPLTPTQMDEWRGNRERSRNPGGKTDAEIKAEADKNKPGAPTLKPDGKGGTIAVQVMPDGSIKATPLPGVPSDKPAPDKVTVNGTIYERKPDGSFAPARGLPDAKASGKLPPDAPRLDLTNATTARTSFMALMSYVDQMRRNGQLTAEEAKDILAIPHAQTTDAIAQETAATAQGNTLRDDRLAQNRDLEGRRASRARESGTMFSNAAQAAGAPGTVRGDLTPGYMQLQSRMAQASGANDMPPEVQIGAINIKPPAPAISPAAVAPSGVAAGTKPAPLLRPNQPVGAAQASAVAAQARTEAAGAPPTAGEPGGPPLAPGPVLGGPVPAAIAPAAPYPAGLPPQAQGPYPSVNPVTGEPTGLTPPGQGAADGNERPDDVLTVYNPQSMQTITITRAKFMEFPPEARAQVVVQSAQPAAMPSAEPVNAKPDFGSPDMTVIPQPIVAPLNTSDQPNFDPSLPRGQMAPPMGVGAVASYQPPASMYDRDEQFMAEGYTQQEIEEARRRVLARYQQGAAA